VTAYGCACCRYILTMILLISKQCCLDSLTPAPLPGLCSLKYFILNTPLLPLPSISDIPHYRSLKNIIHSSSYPCHPFSSFLFPFSSFLFSLSYSLSPPSSALRLPSSVFRLPSSVLRLPSSVTSILRLTK